MRFVREQVRAGARRGPVRSPLLRVKYGLFEAFASPEPRSQPALSVSALAGVEPSSPPCAAITGVSWSCSRTRGIRVFSRSTSGSRPKWKLCPGPPPAEASRRWPPRAGETAPRPAERTRFVLGAPPSLHAALEPLLSPELRDGLILEPLLGPDRPAAAVTERVAHNEREARKVREAVLVQRFLEDLRDGGAVAGLEAAAAALQQGCARLLLVRDGYAKMGRCCGSCGRLSVNHRSCPWCFRGTLPVLDLVAELADRASAAGVEVFRVSADARFDAAGRIGVCLGSPQAPPRADVPSDRALRGLFATKRASLRHGFA